MTTKVTYQSFFKELGIITLGVLIAMLLNSWNEKRKEINQAESYLVGIYEEIEINVKILKESIPYHQSLLDGLRKNPSEVNLSLNPASITNFSWKLSENNIFKENIDRALFLKLAKAYQSHDYLLETQIDAGQRMSEVNIMSPFFMLSTIGKKISDDEKKEFNINRMKSWIPIFETWTYLEKHYLELLEEILKEKNQ